MIETREIERQRLQVSLDDKKSQKERNAMGQFATPYPLASEIMQHIRGLIPQEDVSFLEPAIGTGAFYSAFREHFSTEAKAVGYEIDEHYLAPSLALWEGTALEVRHGDFLMAKPDAERFDLLVANPPYTRHHHIDSEYKKTLQQMVQRQTGIRISGLAGLHCYFILLSSIWLKQGGYSCWLIPGEFMDVNYGVAVRSFLCNNVKLVQIHKFDSDDVQFADALVSSCVVIFKNERPDGTQISLTSGSSLISPSVTKTVSREELCGCGKWSGLFAGVVNEEPCATIGDYFTVKRGVATGDNDFFIVNKETIRQYEIPSQFLTPVLPRPVHLKGTLVEEVDGLPAVERQLFLFSCNLPEETIKRNYPKMWEYIQKGDAKGVSKGYICSKRTPWYACEVRKPVSLLMTYMGRENSSNDVFRFILNKSQATTTNVYLLLYPKPEFVSCMTDPDVQTQVWEALNSIPKETLMRGGRVYGGGLRKVEPKELMHIPAGNIAGILNPYRHQLELTLF